MKVHDPMPNVTYKDMKKIIGLTPAMSMGDSSGQIDSLQTRANSGGIDFAFDNTKRTIIEEEEPPTDPRVLSEFEQNGTSSPDFQSDNPFLGGGIDGGDGEEVIEESTGGPGCKACCDSGGSEDIQLCGGDRMIRSVLGAQVPAHVYRRRIREVAVQYPIRVSVINVLPDACARHKA